MSKAMSRRRAKVTTEYMVKESTREPGTRRKRTTMISSNKNMERRDRRNQGILEKEDSDLIVLM
jgi:hypothetical protein